MLSSTRENVQKHKTEMSLFPSFKEFVNGYLSRWLLLFITKNESWGLVEVILWKKVVIRDDNLYFFLLILYLNRKNWLFAKSKS